ncbi:hypothetical protein RJ641_030349 [Dillenia turbinata]|uniref:Uncharacterized protein n=1 Tax=Dillenia turbinata TaxID=194707 RepID=A0AAN8ZNI5_9MAGN
MYNESFEKKWPSVIYPHAEVQLETIELLRKADELSVKAIENFSASAASKLFDQEIREVLLVVSNFPARRQKVIDKVKRTADALARDLEEAMQKDLSKSIANLENFIRILGKPHNDAAKERLDRVSRIEDELINVEKKLQKLQIEIQNLHVMI